MITPRSDSSTSPASRASSPTDNSGQVLRQTSITCAKVRGRTASHSIELTQQRLNVGRLFFIVGIEDLSRHASRQHCLRIAYGRRT
jgi:hypothetical protein